MNRSKTYIAKSDGEAVPGESVVLARGDDMKETPILLNGPMMRAFLEGHSDFSENRTMKPRIVEQS